MECPDCGDNSEVPAAEQIAVSEIFDGHVDVDVSAQTHLQLECPECGAVLGYHAVGAAIGSNNVRGYY